jgi:hypothetical protein
VDVVRAGAGRTGVNRMINRSVVMRLVAWGVAAPLAVAVVGTTGAGLAAVAGPGPDAAFG